MSYPLYALISVLIFSLVHLFAGKTWKFEEFTQGRFLSLSGGIAISYVFVDLLPKLCISDIIVVKSGFFPYIEKHVYVMALAGFLLFFFVERSPKFLHRKASYLLSLSSYALFNFLIGYAVVDKDDPEVQPLIFFTIAMALHYFVNDFSLSEKHYKDYTQLGKWILILSLFLGWMIGQFIELSSAGVALLGAFIGGGVIMNVIRHELPKKTSHSSISFVLGSIIYTVILLRVGN
jgi:hypothetical protein